MSNERQLAEVRFLTVAEVASIMRVSKMTVYRMVHAGELPAIRVGRSCGPQKDVVHKSRRPSYADPAWSAAERTKRGGAGTEMAPARPFRVTSRCDGGRTRQRLSTAVTC